MDVMDVYGHLCPILINFVTFLGPFSFLSMDIARRERVFLHVLRECEGTLQRTLRGESLPTEDTDVKEYILGFIPSEFQCKVGVDVVRIQCYIYESTMRELVPISSTSFLRDRDHIYICTPDSLELVAPYARKYQLKEERALKKVESYQTQEDRGGGVSETAKVNTRRDLGKNTLERVQYHEREMHDKDYKRRR